MAVCKNTIFALFTGMLCMPSGDVCAQLLKDELPVNARGIDVEDRVGEFIPLDCIFTDERGNKIGLGKYFKQGKPIVLTLNYSDCPGLCIAQLDNLVRTLRAFNAEGMGDDFEIVTVSIDPREDHVKAARTKSKYTGELRTVAADEAWHFLTGKQSEISRLADAVGFRYTYDSANERYNHPAVTYFISPSGRICRYLLSLGVEPQQFQLAVAEANEGKLTLSVADAIIQFCYLYDPNANRYSADARRILAFGAAAFCLLLLGTTAPFWFSRKKKPEGSSGPGNSEGSDSRLAENQDEAAESRAGKQVKPHDRSASLQLGDTANREHRAIEGVAPKNVDAAKQPTAGSALAVLGSVPYNGLRDISESQDSNMEAEITE